MTKDQLDAIEGFVVAVARAYADDGYGGYYRELNILRKAFSGSQDAGNAADLQQLQDAGNAADLQQLQEAHETIHELDVQLKEAKEAAARADETAEGRHRACKALDQVVDQQRTKLREQEQTIQTQQNTISSLMADVARLRGDLGEVNRRNDEQYKLIQSLRGASGTALAQRIRDDMAQVEKYQSSVSFDHLRQILDAYARQGLA